ncbi:hypothetical protein C2L64_46385 [Paraburkholderia hospita]|uniref:Helicase C-terminal domain-containing protein n=2 Tax=Paraburkholderia hospita TaxID=169430 RepID=A0AAN1MR75_9BURK|nr:hypothetical protein C2L64_46385 [Paraburkholderia hospita]
MTNGSSLDAHDEPIPNHPLDLVIFDEAQYLRHTTNFQNRHIAGIFRRNVKRWLFMSATPLHSRASDIRSLDTYLCRQPAHKIGENRILEIPRDCGDCQYQTSCSRMTWQLRAQPEGVRDVVPLLPDFMVRRTRTYADRHNRHYGKIQYRKYERVRYAGSNDPFLSLTMALVQKRLVGVLAGKGNRFRLGECASFESLSTSVGRLLGRKKAHVAEPAVEREYEAVRDAKQGTKEEPGVSVDRTAIDELNRSFVDAMNVPDVRLGTTQHTTSLPHAKLNRAADALFAHSLANGSYQKTLVFVRRIDTVEEIRDLLNVKFQRQLDQRIETWRCILMQPALGANGKTPWVKDAFWETGAAGAMDDADEEVIGAERKADEEAERESMKESGSDEPSGAESHRTAYRDALDLPYFEALKRAAKGGRHGMLVSFGSRLLSTKDASRNPLRGFLLKRPEPSEELVSEANEKHWKNNAARWLRFLQIVLGRERVDELSADPARGWLFNGAADHRDDAWKLAALQLCVLQSIRQTDFLVDLFILHTHLNRTPDGATELPEKLMWLLECDRQSTEGHGLSAYIDNWKEMFRRWIEHFDLIVDKCLRSGAAVSWEEIYRERVHLAFRQMSPVIGRSSRLRNQNAVTQFKFPTHPNVLICTDVLKEGVDMHLFCDNVVHYGVAWTSGDLEQRIGRIDRLGSLIGRRIERFERIEGESLTELPRLGVAFPYLDGTLDHFQVERVIRAKIVSDLRMDLGKRKDEIGELDLSTFDDDESIQVAAKGNSPHTDGVFFPVSALALVAENAAPAAITLPDGIRRKGSDERVPATQTVDSASEAAAYLPAFNCLRVTRIVPTGPGATRLTRRMLDMAVGVLRLSRSAPKDASIVCTEEILVPGACSTGRSLSVALAEGDQTSVGHVDLEGFAFDQRTNTVSREMDMSYAFASREHLSGKVILESIGDDFLLLRTAVCSLAAALATADGRNLQRWLAAKNSGRRWGYLMADADTVWFAVVVSAASGDDAPLLTRLSQEMGRIALYYRSTVKHPGEHAVREYRARTAFPALASVSQAYGGDADLRVSRLLKTLAEGNISSMKNVDLQACGNLLAGVQGWFGDVFDEVLAALYEGEEDSSERPLQKMPLALLDGGILHLRAAGKEHFRIQAYLDLNGAICSEHVISGPKVVWELVASTTTRGKKPELQLSTFEQLPHALPQVWEGEAANGAAAFASTDEKYRFVVLYHHPAAWETARADLLEAWKAVKKKMQELSTFQRKGCRDTLIQAVEPETVP